MRSRPQGKMIPSPASPASRAYLMFPKPLLWNRVMSMLSCFMFFGTMDWAGTMDQFTTAWTFFALSLVRTPVRSVAFLS